MIYPLRSARRRNLIPTSYWDGDNGSGGGGGGGDRDRDRENELKRLLGRRVE